MTDIQKIEKRSLIVAACVNLTMAFLGWIAYNLSNSAALLLDGSYSFISFISILFAIKISSIKLSQTKRLPFGKFVYESLYSLVKSLTIVGILIVSIISSASKIIQYINGETLGVLKTNVILVYSLIAVALCFSLSAYHRYNNRKTNNSSSILGTESISSKVDGFLSLGAGIALVAIGFFSIDGSFGFLHYIGDSILVIILVLFMVKEPLKIVKNSFFEMIGSTLQNKEDEDRIENVLKNCFHTKDNYIFKVGSSYLVIVYIGIQNLDKLAVQKLQESKEKAAQKLDENYKNLTIELILS